MEVCDHVHIDRRWVLYFPLTPYQDLEPHSSDLASHWVEEFIYTAAIVPVSSILCNIWRTHGAVDA